MNRNEDLLRFIEQSPSVFHVVETIGEKLAAAGFRAVRESERWELVPGGKYYVTRNGSSLIAFQLGGDPVQHGYRIAASHSDSPCYKIKSVPELKGPGEYLRLNVESYGAMIDFTWLDRPLGLAGRVYVRKEDRIEVRLLNIERDVLLIPNIAIHFNREVNKGYAFNRQIDLCPLFSAGRLKQGDFNCLLGAELGVQPEEIVSSDLYLVNHEKGKIWGFAEEFVSSPKLDDLQCAYASLEGFRNCENPAGVNVYCCLDNEEVGSNTKQGAMSTFLKDTLSRISASLGLTEEEQRIALSRSFLLSADNAHAVHPNHPEKTDAENCCYMNHGIVIKENAAQKYTTDALSRVIVKEICRRAGEPYQEFANRSDAAGGSTLGNLSNIQVSMHAADVGLPQLAMHSSYETAGARDTESAVHVFSEYFSCRMEITDSESICMK